MDVFDDDFLSSQELRAIDQVENWLAGTKRPLAASSCQPNALPDPTATKRPLPASFSRPASGGNNNKNSTNEVAAPGSITIATTHAETPSLPLMVCGVPDRYCVTAEEVEYSMQQLIAHQPPVVGFDVEWRVTYQTGVKPRPVALIQLCTPTVCLLLHIARTGITPTLHFFLTSSTTLKAGVGAHGDALKLTRDYSLTMEGVVDLSEFANARIQLAEGPKKWSLTALTRHVLNKHIPKCQNLRCSNWETVPLSAEQRQYSSLDAWASLLIYQALYTLPVLIIEQPGLQLLDNLESDKVHEGLDSFQEQSGSVPACSLLKPLQPSKLAVLQLHHSGHSIAEIAAHKKIQLDTAQSYLAEAMLAGYSYRVPLLGLSSAVLGTVAEAAGQLLELKLKVPLLPTAFSGVPHAPACAPLESSDSVLPVYDKTEDLLAPLLTNGVGIRTLKESYFLGVTFGELRVALAHLGRYNQLQPLAESGQ